MGKRSNTQQSEPVLSSDGQTEFDKTKHSEPAKGKQEALHLSVLELETLHQLCILVGKYGIDLIIENLEPIEREYNVRA